jgi:outer membrane protein OmpA-like peptidoglycan-associated protein
MPSSLDFSSTEAFRNRCLTKNLSPYTVPGVYAPPPVTNIVQEIVQTESSVINSPDNLIANDPFADSLYPLNVYGPDGGYDKNINIGGLTNTRSNAGPYDYSDAKLPRLSETTESLVPSLNKYGSLTPLDLISINNIQSIPTFQQYSDPLSFVPSTYTPYEILLNNTNAVGDNGSLSQDSYIAQLGAKQLKKDFQDRIAREIYRNSVGRVNLLNAVGNPLQAIQILQGKTPLIEKNWTISRPSNYVFRAADFIARLGGAYYPASVIPGDYFSADEHNLSLFGQIAKAFNGGRDPRLSYDNEGNPKGDSGTSKLIGRFYSKPSPSQLFLDNTGQGQKSQLYYNLGFNRYAPDYNKSIFGEVADIVKGKINELLDKPTKGGYYVGTKQLDASYINSPAGEVPIDPWGREMQSSVYGPDKLYAQFEGDVLDQDYEFGLKGVSVNEGFKPGISGGLVWTSRNQNSAGGQPTVGGGLTGTSRNGYYNQIGSFKTNGHDFKFGTILDSTQRLLESTPLGPRRLSHAGNAINQLSKVFHDGYKEITKGSKVLKFSNPAKASYTPDNIYCRVFAKDTPYYTFADLQKTDGNIRKFTYSVLDSTYNLNIAPTKNPGSTNIIEGKGVKKYMFSIENLAWRTSNRPGLSVNDLPICEIGPNNGRIMWFPPYDISFSETVTPSFKGQDFLGRPEPVYTYTNTKRSGQLSWKIIVDHASIMNVIADKELRNVSDVSTINGIMDSFIAGCLKYDIYELARRWNTIPPNELFVLQEFITKNNPTVEDVKAVEAELPQTKDVVDTKETPISVPNLKDYEGYSYYFDNDIPNPNTYATTSTTDWNVLYNTYIQNVNPYSEKAPTDKLKDAVKTFFYSAITYNYDKTNALYRDIEEYFNNFAQNPDSKTQPLVTITLVGSASAVASNQYNVNLSARRINSVVNYLSGTSFLAQYIQNGQLKIVNGGARGEDYTATTKANSGFPVDDVDCTQLPKNATLFEKRYSVNAMACRRVVISGITYSTPDPKITKTTRQEVVSEGKAGKEAYKRVTAVADTKTTIQKIKDGISKQVLRNLLSECDYFQVVQKENNMFYESIKDRLKYFNPAFHSMTPEGLNSRLTFLQQCMRPGDTIPTIDKEGNAVYNNSVNTAFGAPPVLVLRIGDFYHTKIIPQSLNITYDPLLFDLNPEGIGVQPMIAKIALNFEIVGGEGLKGPIDKLQNALSFNYYGNTEMYDERADATDDSYKQIDIDLVKAILDESPIATVDNLTEELENGGGNDIGVIQMRFVDNNGISGTTSFQNIMDSLYDGGQSYINILFNKTKEVIKNYNLPMYTLFSLLRNYAMGNTMQFTPNSQDLVIYGKPDGFEDMVNGLFDKIIEDINSVTGKTSNGNKFIVKLYQMNFPSKKIIDVVKTNLIKQVNSAKSDLLTNLSNVIQELVLNEQKLVGIFAKLDLVDTLTDGHIKTNQSTQIYNLTATTEVQAGSTQANTYDELKDDYTSATSKLNSFYNLFLNNKLISYNFEYDDIKLIADIINVSCTVCGNEEKRFYTGMSNIINNDTSYEKFRNGVITSDIANENYNGFTPLEVFNLYYGGVRIYYSTEYKLEQAYFTDKIESVYTNTYKEWNAFVKGKIRKFTFTNYVGGTPTQNQRLYNLYKDGNSDINSATFNGKNKFN